MNHWTVWSENMGSEWLESSIGDDKVKEVAWNYANHCCHCGSCGGGEKKIIFGKEFDDICGCTFRIDNPRAEDLLFLKKMEFIRFIGHHTKVGKSRFLIMLLIIKFAFFQH